MKTLVICNQKGGAAKTTTAAALAAGLARRGFRVLAVDVDPQHNLTDICGAAVHAVTLADVMKGGKLAAAVCSTAQSFDLVPGSIDTATPPSSYKLDSLRAALAPVAGVYDYCIIDTPPALSLVTMSALVAAQAVVIPAKADVLSLYGLDQLQETIEAVRPYNDALELSGVLLTKYNERRNVEKIMRDTIEKKAAEMGTRVFDTTIRAGVAVPEAHLMRQDIYTAAPRSGVAADYKAFIDELLKGDTK